MAFPTSITTFAGFTATHTLAQDNHASQHNSEQTDITAIETKLGTGASTPTQNTVLRGNGTGTTQYDTVHLATDVSGSLPIVNGGTGTTAGAYTPAQVDAAILAAKQALYPVGCVYTEITGTNPATTFGFGTWSAFGAGRVLIGNGTSDATYTAGATGGASTADISHTHTLSDAGQANIFMVSGTGANTIVMRRVNAASWTPTLANVTSLQFGSNTTASTVGAGLNGATDTGGSTSQSTLSPYVVVYFWQRTA